MNCRQTLSRIFQSAVDAVSPESAVRRFVRREGGTLYVNGTAIGTEGKRFHILAAGKGAAPMAVALEDILGDKLCGGHVIVKYGHGLDLKKCRLWEAAHPVPDEAGAEATAAMLEYAAGLGEGDVVFCLFTGGTSALTPAPAAGISLPDMQAATGLLLQCGADIHEINAIRKHLSRFSGGRFAEATAPAEVYTLIISDVIGDNMEVIASGPTVPDTASFADCMQTVEKYSLAEKMPQSVMRFLRDGMQGTAAETPKAGNAVFAKVTNILAASNRQALEAAAQCAEEAGCAAQIVTDCLQGEARDAAADIIRQARSRMADARKSGKPLCLLYGGETTVSIRGKGKGGRNQEMALAAALELRGEKGIACLFAGTDGTDGPTDAAGGFALPDTLPCMEAAGIDPRAMLEDNNSYEALSAGGVIFKTGPTRTNVMDIGIVLLLPEESD